MGLQSFVIKFLKLDRFEPNRIVTSNVVGPKVLCAIRAIELLYVTIALIIVWCNSTSFTNYAKYFTNLTFFGIFAYLLSCTIWSVFYIRVPEAERAHWVKQGNPWWGYTHWLLYSTVVVYSVVVPLVFWTLLSKGMSSWTAMAMYQNISVHAMDGVFGALGELVLSRHFLQPIHSFLVAGVMLLYMLLTFIVYAREGTWVYPFLRWSQGPIAAVYYIGIAIGLFLVFFALYFIHNARNSFFKERSARMNPELEHSPVDEKQQGHKTELEAV
ncbi:hypothetical protein BG015_008686 [Linnemannia schmuckeri]|uniref:Uncharacterized protein n=1 Tax=Linnemannia schmuckeri TaxID=64567 RepID=A0A9P5S8B6_9FUNG|nr:hypothetical protein BG015_008686 [Linnemannia schmuckeri]